MFRAKCYYGRCRELVRDPAHHGCGLATSQPLGPVRKSAPRRLGLRRDRQTNNSMVTTNADLPGPQRNDTS